MDYFVICQNPSYPCAINLKLIIQPKFMKRLTLSASIVAAMWLSASARAQTTQDKSNERKRKLKNYTVDTYKVDKMGWGYDIYENDTLVIHQTRIPAIAEKACFKTQADAKKTGNLVAHKLDRMVFPPAISVSELDSLNVYPK